ncbi:fimbria/pilus outer membrane usher protein, partial [Salmonella enterica subsp. enterica serovar Kentucky]|nr:fimbria/pilus outer membrane usher protein [Salmonella enterica subsp. enterica serovar Kentucky]
DLGVKLLHRTTRQVSMTDEGEEFYQRCLSLLSELDEVRRLFSKYAATVAEYRSDSSQKEKVKFSQATLIWGLPHGFTLYGGTQL